MHLLRHMTRYRILSFLLAVVLVCLGGLLNGYIYHDINVTPSNSTLATVGEEPALPKIKKDPDGKIRILMSTGCSGSSITIRIVRRILAAHGMESLKRPDALDELDKPAKNKYYEDAKRTIIANGTLNATVSNILRESFRMYNREAIDKGKIFLTKVGPHKRTLLLELLKSGAGIAMMYRRNALDRTVCMVRDCFIRETYGYPVFATNSSRTDMCFERRTHKEVPVKAHLNLNKLQEALNLASVDPGPFQQFVDPGRPQAYEDLFAFEYSTNETVFRGSVASWVSMLDAFVDDLDEDVVAETIRPLMGTRDSPGPHSLVIDNIDEVAAALKSPYKGFIRMDPDQ